MLGVTQPGESARRHYKLAAFSFGRLMHLLTLLDKDVEIVIRREPRIAEGWPDRRRRGLIAAIDHADAYDIGRALEEHSMARNRKAVVQKRQPFKKARRRAVARLRAGLDLEWTPERAREKLHERG